MQEQAAKYNKAATLTDDSNRIGTQIGKGVYTTAGLGDWKGGANDWFVTTATLTCFQSFLNYPQVLRHLRRLQRS